MDVARDIVKLDNTESALFYNIYYKLLKMEGTV